MVIRFKVKQELTLSIAAVFLSILFALVFEINFLFISALLFILHNRKVCFKTIMRVEGIIQ